jgi:hypothetical protein
MLGPVHPELSKEGAGMTDVARRDIRTISGTRAYVENTLAAHRRSVERLTPIEPVPGTAWMYTVSVRLLPEGATRPLAVGRVTPYQRPRPRRRPVPRWVLWSLVVVGLVVLVVLTGIVAVWLLSPDAPPPTAAPAPDAHAHTAGDSAVAGLVGMLAIGGALYALVRWSFGSGKSFSGTFQGKMD